VDHDRRAAAQVLGLLPEPVDDLVLVRLDRPLPLAAGRVVAEQPDERGPEVLRDVDGPLEPVEVLRPRPVDRDLPDRRPDRDDAEPVVGQLRLDLRAERVVEVHDVLAVHAAELEVGDAVGPADADLVVEVRADLVGERAELEHGGMVGRRVGGVKSPARPRAVGRLDADRLST
jgi:hypothetical protein